MHGNQRYRIIKTITVATEILSYYLNFHDKKKFNDTRVVGNFRDVRKYYIIIELSKLSW